MNKTEIRAYIMDNDKDKDKVNDHDDGNADFDNGKDMM